MQSLGNRRRSSLCRILKKGSSYIYEVGDDIDIARMEVAPRSRTIRAVRCKEQLKLFALGPGAWCPSRVQGCLSRPITGSCLILNTHKTGQVMALATIESPPRVSAALTSVHPKETTTPDPPKIRYRDSLIILCEDEYNATKKAYHDWDLETKKWREFELDDCRTNAWFAIHMPTRTVRVLSSACRLRWCPLCSKSKSARIVGNLEPWLHLCHAAKFLTLTLKHSDESLDRQITRLYSCFSTFRKRRYIKESITGGIWFFQIKFCKDSGQWHPHLHCVLDGEYMPQKTIKAIWHEITGDSDIVDIRSVRSKKKAAEYVARDAARPARLAGLTPPQAVEVMSAMHGRRLCGTWGSARSVKLTVTPDGARDEYFSVCAYGDLLRLAKNSQFADKIREAFVSKKPLDIICSQASLCEYGEEMYADNRQDMPPPPKRYEPLLFDTGPANNCVS